MASEYKKRGGDYTTDKKDKDESQKNLDNWTEEEWQTKESSGHAKKEDGTQKRYLTKKAWEKMSEEEKQATDQKKQKESKEGKQFVGNTEKAKESRKKASKSGGKKDDGDGDDDVDDIFSFALAELAASERECTWSFSLSVCLADRRNERWTRMYILITNYRRTLTVCEEEGREAAT